MHVSWAGITKELFKILGNPTKYEGISWNCDSCLASGAPLEGMMQALQEKAQEIENCLVRNEGLALETNQIITDVEKRRPRWRKK